MVPRHRFEYRYVIYDRLLCPAANEKNNHVRVAEVTF